MRTTTIYTKKPNGWQQVERKEKELRSLFYFYAYNPTTRLCLATTAAIACIYVIGGSYNSSARLENEKEQMAH